MKTQVHTLISALCLFFSISASAHNVGGAGGFHGGAPANGGVHNNAGFHNNGGYHHNVYNNGYHNGYHHDNAWYGGGGVVVNTGDDDVVYGDGLIDDESTNTVIGVPEGGYYDPSCQTVQTCNSDGVCVTQQNCN